MRKLCTEGNEAAEQRRKRKAEGKHEAQESKMVWAEDGTRDVKGAREVGTPTNEEWRRHVLSGHAVYRPWCPACVAGRGRSDYHRRTEQDRKTETPVIAVDCAFFGRRGDVTQDDRGGNALAKGSSDEGPQV